MKVFGTSTSTLGMLTQMIDVTDWTAEQWIAACILAFFLVTILVVIHRLIRIFQISRESKYQPNLRLLRRSQLRHKVKEES